MTTKIPKRITTAIFQSLAAGVVPRTGLEHIAVGRKDETNALLSDLDDVVADGGATFRLILGRYGSGKSFLGQLVRNYALQRNFVVADADLSTDRRLTGSKGEGLNLYRELLNNMATRLRPDGNAFASLLERWISDLQSEVIQQSGLSPSSPQFANAVEKKIRATIDQMEGLVHGFDFATVINAYWRGHLTADDQLQGAALRWLRGEYTLKAEAREALGVRVIIDDSTWYDYIKLLASFVRDIGYQGLVIFLDEAVNLYKISHTISRANNYERLLTILNDTLQGKAAHLAIIVGTTPQMVEDNKRGLFSYEALRTRLEESRYTRGGLRDLTGPMIRLDVLSSTEIFVLLQQLRDLHGIHHKYEPSLTDEQIHHFMTAVLTRLGTEQMITPREVVRDFVTVLNLLHQNPTLSFDTLVDSESFQVTTAPDDPEILTAANEIHDSGEEVSPAFATFRL
ncbi:MAG: ATP-binding protein [Caldilineaceae bacterium]|nr:ATP-binding protein [Caldilineaceae bacterium]